MEELTLHDLVTIIKRRRNYFLITFAVLFAVVTLFALHWSNYRAIATVQIEQSDVSQTVAAPAGSSNGEMVEALADQRISEIEQTVTSMDSLAAIINKFNLYPGVRQTTPMAVLATRMRNKIKLDFISSTIANPAEAQKASAEQLSAIAFTLSFDYSNPLQAQQVTDELVSRFLDEDLKLRRKQAEETSAFLGSQISALENTMAEQEKKIAEFTAKNGESGPNAQIFNQQAESSTSLQLQTIEAQITSNEGTEGSLRAQLATTDPYSRVIANGQVLTTPAVQLKALQAQYAALSGQYGPDHPDVVKLRHQIDSLKAEQDNGDPETSNEDTAKLRAQIRDVETNLAAARSTDGPDNPDVAALQHQLKQLKSALAGAGHGASSGNSVRRDADNPAYIQITSQIQAVEEQHKSLLAQRDSLIAQQEKYQRAIAAQPVLQQQMDVLARDYDNEQLRYRELKEKKMEADMSEQLEAARKGQRLTVSIPPALPLKTHPSRLLLLAGGFVLSVLGGCAAIIISESASLSIHGSHHLAHLTGAMPLVTIPHIRNKREIEEARRRRPYRIAGMAAVVILALVAFPYVLMPYDVLWNTISQKLNF